MRFASVDSSVLKVLNNARLERQTVAPQRIDFGSQLAGIEAEMMAPSRFVGDDPEAIPQELRELMAEVAALPEHFRIRLEPVLERVIESARRRRKVLGLVQEALAQLRLDMKYLIFDLEATRRERDAYRRIAEGNK